MGRRKNLAGGGFEVEDVERLLGIGDDVKALLRRQECWTAGNETQELPATA